MQQQHQPPGALNINNSTSTQQQQNRISATPTRQLQQQQPPLPYKTTPNYQKAPKESSGTPQQSAHQELPSISATVPSVIVSQDYEESQTPNNLQSSGRSVKLLPNETTDSSHITSSDKDGQDNSAYMTTLQRKK